MKAIVKSIFVLFIAIIGLSNVNAQTGAETGTRFGSGEDSIQCIRNLSLYVEYYKQNNYEDAAEYWMPVYKECPKATKNIFIHGEKMIRAAIEDTEDEKEKATLIDSLMGLYNKRIKYYDEEGYVLGKKGVYFIRYAENSIENFKRGYDYLKKSIELQENNANAGVLVTFMNTSKSLFSNEEIKGEEMVKNYANVLEIIESRLEGSSNSESYQRAYEAVNEIFEKSGAATCENLTELYKPRFENNPEDKELLERIIEFLEEQECTDDKFYADVTAQLNEIDPSAESAHHLARLFYEKEQYEKSVEYYKQAIELQDNDEEKGSYYMELAELTYSKLEDKSEAREYAREAIDADPDNGRPYILIGRMYANSADECGEDEFEKQTIYWIAVDQFEKAKEIDEDLEGEANGYIDSYAPRFPSKEDCFFHNYDIGDTYEIGCWINESTTVRASD
ncbi:MAG: tetratricopeptide repeat protein [Bacteroidales bacterium]